MHKSTRKMFRVISLASLCLTAIASYAVDESQYVEMYRDYPIGTWKLETPQGGTWESRTDNVFANERAARVTLNPNQVFQIRDSWGGLDKTGATHLEFYLYADNQLFNGFDIDAATELMTGPRISLASVSSHTPGQWSQVRVPLSALGLTSGTRFKFFRLHNFTGSAMQFYIDEIRLVRPVQTSAAVTINTGIVDYTLPGPMWGAGGSIFNPYFDHDTTKLRVREGGINAFTYPGGADANAFDWRTNMEIRNNVAALLTVNGYLKMSDQLNAEKIIAVNYGSGTPQDARDWVEYANITRSSNVKHWVIGNENYGVWSYDTHPFRHDAISYAEFAIQAIQMMKAVDPTIKVGINGLHSESAYPQRISVPNPRTGQMVNGWTPVVMHLMKQANVVPDWIDVHYYPQGPLAESDPNLIQSSEYWDRVMPPMQQMITDYFGTQGANMKMYVTENNGVFFNPGRQSVSVINALYLMKSWVEAVKYKAGAFVWWRLHQHVQTVGNLSTLLYGWRNYGDYGVLARNYPPGISPPVNEPYPSFYAFKLMKIFARPGFEMIRTTSNNKQITVAAARNPATGRLNLLICNNSKETIVTARVTTLGYPRTESPTVFTWGATEDIAMADVRVYRVPIAFSGRDLDLHLAPYSMSVVEL
ncbi:MAG: hypothetical protein ABIV13_05515 [Fimbriimonadales bacterium]